MKAYIKTYGCQMNEQDSLQMRGLLNQIGYQTAFDPIEADLILLVTCSIREKAVQKVYSDLGRARALLENNPDLIVGVCGCVAQQEKNNLSKRFPFISLIFGPDAIHQLPEMIKEVHQRRKSESQKIKAIVNTRLHSKKEFEFVNLLHHESENRTCAFVNIQKGCDNVCSFCIVPYVRGREVSRPSSDIIREVGALVELGVKDITLLGQNVNSYGLKDSSGTCFSELLEKILTQIPVPRLRFMTSHPKDIDDDLIALFQKYKSLAPHLHLPVQSGSNDILKAMRRQYTREHYLEIISKLRGARPDICFSTDVIVGFPGETDKNFEDTLSLLEKVSFDMVYSFVYSPRPYTMAVKLNDDVSLEVKNKRLNFLQEFQREISKKQNQKVEYSEQEVLVEAWDAQAKNWTGRTATNKIVHAVNKDCIDRIKPDEFIGELMRVKINQALRHSLKGEIIYDR